MHDLIISVNKPQGSHYTVQFTLPKFDLKIVSLSAILRDYVQTTCTQPSIIFISISFHCKQNFVCGNVKHTKII